MMIDRDTIQGYKMHQLKHLIVAMGGEPSPNNEKRADLETRILLESAKEAPPRPTVADDSPQQDDDAPMPSLEPKAEDHEETCTMQQVMEAVNPFILRGLKVYHYVDEDTKKESWLFRIKLKSIRVRDTNTGEWAEQERWGEDSGTVNQPLSVIKRCATRLMQKAPRPGEVRRDNKPSDKYSEVA
jgi:hypothetical protein